MVCRFSMRRLIILVMRMVKLKLLRSTERFFMQKKSYGPGAFINSFPFLEQKLAVRLKGETTILARVSLDEARRLEKLPSLLYETMDRDIQNIYLVRPLQYPDGNYYLKWARI